MNHLLTGKPLEGFAEYVREAAAQGAVLLKNDGQVLPLLKGERAAVFGRTQINYYRSGTGSGGSVNVEYTTNLLDGLRNSSVAEIDEELAGIYEAWIREHPYDDGEGLWGAEPWHQEEMELSEEIVQKAAGRSQKAVIVLGRTAGEDKDYSNEEGGYLLTAKEREMLRRVTKYFDKTAVVLNVSGIMDMSWLDEEYVHPVSSVLYVWQGGIEGGNAAADVLTGKVTPSGKLTDTIARRIEDYPAYKNYGDAVKNIYEEDIYVGYRYFETFGPDRVRFPFGFGLSYTEFSISSRGAVCDGEQVAVTVEVENTGTSYSGREVVQVYFEAPQGRLGRPARELAGFAKTRILAPGEKQEVTVTFPVSSMAAYDDTGAAGKKSCYVLEEGLYRIWAGSSVRDLEAVQVNGAEGYCLPALRVAEALEEAAAPEESFRRMRPGVRKADGAYELAYEDVPVRSTSLKERIRKNLPKSIAQQGNRGIRLQDVKEKKASMEEFIAQLSDEELAVIVRGEGMCSPKVTPGTASAFGGVSDTLVGSYGIPVAAAADGPSGIRMDTGAKATQVPIGTLLACSWDLDMMEHLYELEGREMMRNEIDLLLGPGINIHRHPMNGRNFEYFSEDPLVTGKFASAMVRGIQRAGARATVKHMACNSQEANRNQVNAVVSERALREIYLKGFELSVKEGGAKAIMTSYNPVNGRWSASSYDMLTTILRGEWGYDGIVMTDWWAKMNNAEEGGPGSIQDTASMIKAQNDLYMVVNNYEACKNGNRDNTLERLREGWLTRGELQRCAMNICRFLMDAPVMERRQGDLHSVEKIPAGAMGDYHEAGIYTLYISMVMDQKPEAQGAANIFLNDRLVAQAQTNGTEGRTVRKLLVRAELESGNYVVRSEDIKPGIRIVGLEFVKE
ncbi:MAG: glycoside hydrolase family 3 C-terminal domain-containing protein [Lachnospiraceae bacterium]|nr:glycoside hydrolase family 3 C-terminal domain-containing protein [Lachnospiraceae bacterium]